MTLVEQLGEFVAGARFEALSGQAVAELKIRLLDSLGCAIGALDAEPMRLLEEDTEEFCPGGPCTLVGGGRTSPDRAAFHNAALVRYLDFNDSYLAPKETCHPSDNIGAILAAAEYAGAVGRDLLTAMAVAYQVQCRLSDVAPVRDRGFDHTVQGAYGAAAGVSRALGLDAARTANAIAISGTAFNALRVTRTGALSHWKGLAAPHTAAGCTEAAFLAKRGITGPREVFEGNKGLMGTITGPFEIDWSHEDLERVTCTVLKKYNAEIHSQSTIDAILELRRDHHLAASMVDHIRIDIFDVAFRIIGGGEEGDKLTVRTKEEADHSLRYMAAVAMIDGQVLPEQYKPERIGRADAQDLLRRVTIEPTPEFSKRFPQQMPCRVTLALRDGRRVSCEKYDYEGFTTRPMRWDAALKKFDALTAPHADEFLRGEISEAIAAIEALPVRALMQLLAAVH